MQAFFECSTMASEIFGQSSPLPLDYNDLLWINQQDLHSPNISLDRGPTWCSFADKMQVLDNAAPCLDVDLDAVQVSSNQRNESREYVRLRKVRV